MTSLLLRKLIDLILLTIEARPSFQLDASSKHIHDLHDNASRKIALSNENYKEHTDLKRMFDDFGRRYDKKVCRF